MPLETPNKDLHPLYYEALRKASEPQAHIVHSERRSIMLTMPNNIIFELIGTIVSETPQEQLVKYVQAELKSYLKTNWTNKTTQRIVNRLRREQAIDLKAENGVAAFPVISKFPKRLKSPSKITTVKSVENSSSTSKSGSKDKDKNSSKGNPVNDSGKALIDQVYDHVMWRIRSDKVTQITSLMIKLLIEDGYKRNKLKVKLYDDVKDNFLNWRSKNLIKLYSFGNAPAFEQKLMLASTTQGDMTQWIANYIDGSDKKSGSELIKKLASALRDKTNNCIYITHDLEDALRSIETGAIRCVFLLDRQSKFKPLDANPIFQPSSVKSNITQGKLYVMESLDCVDFVSDPTTATCC